MIPPLETPRLWLRPMCVEDAPQIQDRFPHLEILRFMASSIPWPYPPDGALTWIRNTALPEMARGAAWHWTLRTKAEPDQVIGAISLMNIENNNRGFWLGIPWQGQGFMSEAAEAVTDFWFDVLNFPVMRVPKAVLNSSSRRISEKQGMRIVMSEERDYVSGRYPADVWEITADEWQARRQSSIT